MVYQGKDTLGLEVEGNRVYEESLSQENWRIGGWSVLIFDWKQK